MSVATELAEKAALEAEAEPEPEDDDTEDGPEPEDEPEATVVPPAGDDLAMQRKLSNLEKEAERHAKAVEKIMGEDFAILVPCPLDFTPGFAMAFQGQPVDYDQRAAVLALFGEQAEPELKQHPNLVMCEVCDGWGEVLTGGKSQSNRIRPCPKCNADGAIPANLPPVYEPPAAAPALQAVPQPGFVPLPEGELPPVPGAMWDYVSGGWKLPAGMPAQHG